MNVIEDSNGVQDVTVVVAPLEPATGDPPSRVVLVRYGAVPQLARFSVADDIMEMLPASGLRDTSVVVDTDRGQEVGRLLDTIRDYIITEDKPVTGTVLRIATDEDLAAFDSNRRQADVEYFDWHNRITDWGLELQLIDLEWTLDQQQLILYVLNGRSAETTRLALLSAAAGLGIVHVQPVAADGIVAKESGGCGSGGCGSGGCGH